MTNRSSTLVDGDSSQRGTALLVVVLVMFLFAAIALGAAIVARVEVLIGERYRGAAEALFAADAGLDAVIADLRAIPDWTAVVNGTRQSALSQGLFQGSKAVPRSGSVLICCGPGSMAGQLAIDTQQSSLPARRALQWRPFLWTTLDALTPHNPPSRLFVVVWVGNDEADTVGAGGSDTNDSVLVRSEAVDHNGLRRIVEALVARHPRPAGGLYSEGSPLEEARLMRIHVLNWREVR
jgi:hypothetical protein